MSEEARIYKHNTIIIAKQLCYNADVISRLKSATTESEIARIMKTARTQED